MKYRVTQKLLKEMCWSETSWNVWQDRSIAAAFIFAATPQGHDYWQKRREVPLRLTPDDYRFLAECERVFLKRRGK